MEPIILDDLDYKILGLIANDTRISFLEVSRICNVSGAAVHQRVHKMTANNIIIGSEFKLNFEKIGFKTCTYMRLKFKDASDIDSIADSLNNISELLECHRTLDNYDLLVRILSRDNAHLLRIIENKIRPLGLCHSESIVSYKEYFKKQIRFTPEEEAPQHTTE